MCVVCFGVFPIDVDECQEGACSQLCNNTVLEVCMLCICSCIAMYGMTKIYAIQTCVSFVIANRPLFTLYSTRHTTW